MGLLQRWPSSRKTGRQRALPMALLVILLATACSPGFDWREVQPAGSGLSLLFPCKPASLTRSVDLAGQSVDMTLHACRADGVTFAVGQADMRDPTRVEAALDGLQEAAARNIQGTARIMGPAPAEGATPNRRALRIEILGRLDDGSPVYEQVAVFAKGTRVYQATMLGASLPSEATDMFFGHLRLR